MLNPGTCSHTEKLCMVNTGFFLYAKLQRGYFQTRLCARVNNKILFLLAFLYAFIYHGNLKGS